jgi:short-subunit dehydrogenase
MHFTGNLKMNYKKIVLIGASGGIGSALSRSLRGKGSRVFLIARNRDNLRSLGNELESDFFAGDMYTV